MVETAANNESASVAKLSTEVAEVKTGFSKSEKSVQEAQKRVSALAGVVGVPR